MTHLFLFTIGPVQSFIAQARKTQDLYAGSRLLSVLTKKAIDEVESKKGSIIYPFIKSASRNDSIPNRFIAKIKLENNETPQSFGMQIEKAVRDEWGRIAMQVLCNWGLKAKRFSIPPGFAEQIQQHLTIQWVIEELNDDYVMAYRNLEKHISAIKNTSIFEQYGVGGIMGETGRKCSVDGQRNVKFYRRSASQDKWGDIHIRETHLFGKDNVIIDFEDNGIPLAVLQPGEGLSGVSFVKRGYRENGNNEEFPSTADIALQKTIAFWKNNCRSDYDSFIGCFGEKPFDAQLFYEENLTQKYFKKQGYAALTNDLTSLQAQRSSLEELAKKNNFKLTKYYAILLFDGDGMGELLGGERLADGKDLATFHTDFSEKLGDFAGAAKTYLDSENRGRTVYAGGDDFLGFVNLESLFEVLAHFQCKFRELVSTPMRPYLKDTNGITFSAGICIAHYKEPLSLVLNRARAMEQKAKDYRKSKNAFGIAVIKGSGEDHDTVWGFENDNITKLEYLTESLRKEHFSNTFIKNFQREFAPVLKENEQVPISMQGMFQIELTRLAERSCDLPNKKDEAAKLSKMLWLDLFLSQQLTSKKATIGNFFEMLNICDFLHRTLNPVKQEANAESTN